MSDLIIGIDPGQSGGIAVLDMTGAVVSVCKMPASNDQLLYALGRFGWSNTPAEAVLEFVRSSPVMGQRAAFTFGWGVGAIEMALTAAGVPYSVVVPRKWQAGLGIGKTGGDKNITKDKAFQLFNRSLPDGQRMTHAIADALLIAEYGRRHKLGLVEHKPTRRV